MPALAILNPRPKSRRARSGGRKRRRPMTAKQLKFFGPRKSRKVATRKKARAKPSVVIVQSNPKGTRMAKKTRHHRRRKASAKPFVHKRVKRYRRNPRSIEAGFFNNTLVPSAIGAAGAVGADMLLGYLPVPAQYKTGMIGAALRIASALAIGAAVGAVSNREAGEEAAAGGVIVTLYQLSRGFMAGQSMAAAAGAGMGRYVPMNGMGRYVPMAGFAPGNMNRGAGGYAPNRPGLGYMNPARVALPSRAQLRGMMGR